MATVTDPPIPGNPGGDEFARADSGKPPTVRDVKAWLSRMVAGTGHGIEIRAPLCRTGPGRTATVVERFAPDDIEEAARAALRLSGRAPAVYLLMNGVDPTLPVRKGCKAAETPDIPKRVRILIDIDPVRPGTVNATDTEKAVAHDLAVKVKAWLDAQGWPAPIVADSGNGYHFVYGVDLPNDGVSYRLIEAILNALADRFDTSAAKVDTTVKDAPRLVKLYGTRVCKGDDTPERPARYARVIELPVELAPVPLDLLESLAAEAPVKEAPTPPPTNGTANGHGGGYKATNGRPDALTRAMKYLATCEPAISGSKGHNKAFKAACKVGPGFDLSPETLFGLLRDIYNPTCEPPWSERELWHKVEDAYKVETRRGWLLNADRNGHHATNGKASADGGDKGTEAVPPAEDAGEPVNQTDLGNALRLVRRFGNVLRYHTGWGSWLEWDGRRWQEDKTGAIHRKAKQTVRGIAIEAAECEDDDRRKALLKWAIQSEQKKLIDAMIGLAWNEPGIPVEPDRFDRDPWLLNVENGTVDLRTGELRPHSQADLITKLAPVRYDLRAECPRWMRFLDRVMAGNEELTGFLQRAAGYALTGNVSEHALFFLYGTGRNGKGTFLETLLAVMGDYATTIDANLLTAKRNDDHPTGLTDLDGRRFVATVEVDDGKRMAEALVKKLTGGDRIKARRMRQDNYEFNPTHKLFLAANHKPEIRGTDEGIWSRIKMIPFEVYIPPEERQRDLKDKLVSEEGPGILAWALRGCRDWQDGGLREPAVVQAMTQDYRAESDFIGTWIAERCNSYLDHPTLRDQSREPMSALYLDYCGYAKENGIEPMPQPKLGTELENRGYRRKPSNGKQFRLGIRLKATADKAGDDREASF